MSTPTHPSTISNEFDAAREIVAILKALDAQQRMRAIRYACESLEVPTPTVVGPPSLGSPPATLATGLAPGTQVAPPDIKQFSDSKIPKSDQQFAAVVAYFYRFIAPEKDRKEAITAEDLKEAARLVGRTRPHRITLNNAKNAGYLDPAERGRFKISTVGENLVAVTLPGGEGNTRSGRKRAKGPRKTGKRRAKRTS